MSENMRITPVNIGQEHWIACDRCRQETRHTSIAAVHVHDSNDDNDIHMDWDLMAVRCQGCDALAFIRDEYCSEDTTIDDHGHQVEIRRRDVFPPRLLGRSRLPDEYHLPAGVRDIYVETHSALSSDMPVLAGIGIRAIVEALCRERQATGDNLLQRIDQLKAMGLVSPDGASILHNIRALGNAAAHETKAHTTQELAVAFEVVESLLMNVYILPKRAAVLASAPSPTQPTPPTTPPTTAPSGTSGT